MSKIGDVVIEREQDFYTLTAQEFTTKYSEETWLQMADDYLEELWRDHISNAS
jgi:hypothetical protein